MLAWLRRKAATQRKQFVFVRKRTGVRRFPMHSIAWVWLLKRMENPLLRRIFSVGISTP
ncbi:MAG TPA: hypothetical protein PK472_01190 [Pseudomonadota bacterium]|nr:hypothetical protein [Pseudomonadota bacterium]